MQTITTRSQRFSPVRILAIGLILYACAFAILLRNRTFEPAAAVVVLFLFGGVFPLLAWGRDSSRCAALDFRQLEYVCADHPNRICHPIIALPDRRPTMD